MSSIIKGTIFGAIVAYLWVIISWMVLPWHDQSYMQFKSPPSVVTTLERNTMGKGIYIFPAPENMEKLEDTEESHARGRGRPRMFVFAAVNPSLEDAFNAMTFVKAFLAQLATAFFITWLVKAAHINHYVGRVVFVVGVAIAGACAIYLPFMIWWQFSNTFIGIMIADLLATWLFAGLAIAAFTGRRTVPMGFQ